MNDSDNNVDYDYKFTIDNSSQTKKVAFYKKGVEYYKSREYENAIHCFDKAIELDETNANPWNGKGNIYFYLNEYKKALVCYDKAIELDGTLANPWNGKGNVYSDLKEYMGKVEF